MNEMNDETTGTNLRQNPLIKRVVATVIFAASFIIPNTTLSGNNLLRNRMSENSASSISASTRPWIQTRAERLRSLRGKYAFVNTSSEDFAQRKQREIDSEE